MLQFFVADEYWKYEHSIIDATKGPLASPFYIRTYNTLDVLESVQAPNNTSPFKPFEAEWQKQILIDYPTHDTMPIDFDALDIGDYYDQEGVEQVYATKLGGWPSCIQSEPWWDYREEGKDFEFALQIDSEEKANCWWGDNGSVYVARHKTKKDLWVVDWQCY